MSSRLKMEGQQERSFDSYMSSLRLPRLILVQMALRAAVELQVFDIISQSGPKAKLSASEIISKIPTKNPNAAQVLNRILRMLTTNSILSASSRLCDNQLTETVYALTEDSRYLVSDTDGKCLSSLVLLSTEKESVDCLYGLKDTVLEPGRLPLYDAHHGLSFFEDASEKPRFNRLFNEAMVDYSSILMDQVLKAYQGFHDLDEIMDVGGGCGTSLKKIVSLHPHVRGINFDTSHVIADAPIYPGIDHVAGDMFEFLPKAQSIFLKWILHNWDDEQCVKLLRNCWEALPENGKVMVAEFIVPQQLGDNNSESSLEVIQMDFVMLLYFNGKERTKSEFDVLATAAGFNETKIFPVVHGFHVLELIKKK